MKKATASVASLEVEGRRGERQGDIIRAARHMFANRGFDKTTMADIAEAIGVAEGTVYIYFSSKQELVTAVAVDWFREIAAATGREVRSIHGPADRLRFLIQRHLDVILQNPDLYLTLVREVRGAADYAQSRGRKANRGYTALLKHTLGEAIEAGAVSTDLAPPTLRDLIYGGIEHVAWSAILRGETKALDTAKLAAGIAATFLRGIGLQPSAPTSDVEARLQRIETKLGL
jgi:AcrR family transcriptional regulator